MSPALSTQRPAGRPGKGRQRGALWAEHTAQKSTKKASAVSRNLLGSQTPRQLSAYAVILQTETITFPDSRLQTLQGAPWPSTAKKSKINIILTSFPLFQPLSAIPSVQAPQPGPFPCADPSSVVIYPLLHAAFTSPGRLPPPHCQLWKGKSAPPSSAQSCLSTTVRQTPSSKFPSTFWEALNRKGRLK